ncbi:MAG: hypothetical protein IKO39_07340, partial [Treponema sp.]|nr:hypothetical protein [Treponema sp.]
MNLPLWLDSFGTVISAYLFGPFCGSLVGITMNIVYSDFSHLTVFYSLASVIIAVIVGIVARKKWFDSLFGTMSATVLLTISCVLISFSISWVVSDGMTRNSWGDGVIKFLEEEGVPCFVSSLIGNFYLDFLDKTVTLVSLYLCLKFWRRRKAFLNFFTSLKHKLPLAFFALLAL